MRTKLAEIPTHGLANFIDSLARTHGVQYAQTPTDVLANTITRLVDDEVVFDKVERQLLALERAGVINSEDVVPLHISYLREKFGRQLLAHQQPHLQCSSFTSHPETKSKSA